MTTPKREKKVLNGWLNLYKPLEISSAQAVGRAKFLTQAAKMGHAGTLDPLADGVLPLALGEATKATALLMHATKTYHFTVRWGIATTTDDREGEVISEKPERPAKNNILQVCNDFMGNIEQVPPAFSALKVNGERAYDLARKGQHVVLKPRTVRIDSLVLAAEPERDSAQFRVVCGKGTYVRSLARDIALALGTVGHVATLTREAVGNFHINDAISLDFLEKSVHNPPALEEANAPHAWLRPIASVLDDILALECDAASIRRLRFGQSILAPTPCAAPDGQVAVLSGGEIAALCAVTQSDHGPVLKPNRIFNIE